jgi:hypothetical protein
VLLSAYPDLTTPTAPPPPSETPLALFGDGQIALLSATPVISPTLTGATLLEVKWQALQPLTQDYTLFVHAFSSNGERAGQLDTMPLQGKLPTTRWPPGKVITDRLRIPLAAGAPSQGFRFELGWYQYQTGERLRTASDDKVVVDGSH